MYYFCTYFDSHFLPRGLVLYRSLTRFAAPFKLWVLCLDDFTCRTLRSLNLPNLLPIALGEFEEGDHDLLQTKRNRSRIEYYFTCTPSLILYILRKYQEVDVITYLDADLMFYDSPTQIYEELGDESILIIAHRFPERLRRWERFGVYNVGLLAFRNDSYGKRCLEWWRERCLEWCYDRVEDGKFADQKYLDDWPSRFKHVVVLRHKGSGLAPWNLSNYRVHLQDGRVYVDEDPLVFYHFAALTKVNRWIYTTSLEWYGNPLEGVIRRHLYAPYIMSLWKMMRWMKSSGIDVDLSRNVRSPGYDWKAIFWKTLHREIAIAIGPLVF